MKKIIIISMVVAFLAVFYGAQKSKSQEESQTEKKKVISVEAKSVSESKIYQETLSYPGLVVSFREAKVTAQTGGIIKSANFELGDKITQGRRLVIIDDGTTLSTGKNNFKSGQIQQLEQALRQAKESLDLAKKNHEDQDTDASKTARDIAASQYESAEIALSSTLDSHLAIAPISGTVTKKAVSVGDSVSPGQLIATISQTQEIKIQFHVDGEKLKFFTNGKQVRVGENGGEQFLAKVANISSQADATTRKFMVEAMPEQKINYSPGTIVNVTMDYEYNVSSPDSIIVPLSALTVSQNENYLFVSENGNAKKVTVTVMKIEGERAEIQGSFADQDEIITSGNKLLQDGDAIEIKN